MDADVIVLGGGNAALNAAIAARHEGASVLLLEGAPEYLRGGNTRHTRDIRYAHSAPKKFVDGVYSQEEFMDDLLRVTAGETNRPLAELALRESESIPDWMEQHGVRWQKALHGTLQLTRTNGFFLGGGKAMVNTYFDTAQRMGVQVRYNAVARDLVLEGDRAQAVVANVDGVEQRFSCRAVVVASGGFEANLEWLKRYWGDSVDNFIIRGTPHNTGLMLHALLELGARQIGDPKGFHAVAVDARAPQFDGGIITRVDAIPFGICVNREGRRFYDEGEDLWPKRYAIWGGLIAAQPGQTAFAVYDSKIAGGFIPTVFAPIRAESLEALARQIDVDSAAFLATVAAYNAAASKHGGTFAPGVLDDCTTHGLTLPKSHWALPIDRPPFYCYPVKPGITFTYLGVGVDAEARVQTSDGAGFANIFAAGECMAGNILSRGYLAGFGLTIGTVFGRIAGREAGKLAR